MNSQTDCLRPPLHRLRRRCRKTSCTELLQALRTREHRLPRYLRMRFFP
ncbi:hypothetical protein EVA_10706 [gut metagenome]|uniref:Uncharacterized protein n=1 Tax=gut metagenome TaxID=749906 RepID=J9GMV7_9ZZZZ